MEQYGRDIPDMSDYVVHFTRGSGDRSAYDVMMSILSSGQLRASGPYGIGVESAPDPDSQKVVCFSEAPLDALERIIENRGLYGIAFSKRFLLSRGGGAVWYVEPGSSMVAALEELLQGSRSATTDPAWQLTPFIELPGPPPDGPFRWEREWRHVGDLEFGPTDPSFLFVPEDLHAAASGFFIDAGIENTGPAYLCSLLDPRWNRTRIETELAAASVSLYQRIEQTRVPGS